MKQTIVRLKLIIKNKINCDTFSKKKKLYHFCFQVVNHFPLNACLLVANIKCYLITVLYKDSLLGAMILIQSCNLKRLIANKLMKTINNA